MISFVHSVITCSLSHLEELTSCEHWLCYVPHSALAFLGEPKEWLCSCLKMKALPCLNNCFYMTMNPDLQILPRIHFIGASITFLVCRAHPCNFLTGWPSIKLPEWTNSSQMKWTHHRTSLLVSASRGKATNEEPCTVPFSHKFWVKLKYFHVTWIMLMTSEGL